MSDELKPCPFCGGGTTQFVENGRVWSGMKYTDPISVSVQHWCDPVPGQPSRGIERVGRDKASAITLWNTRADDTLRTQLATMTAGRDALQTSMNELRKTCAEIIGADPQTWPDHGNAPLAIAACLGLRDAELQKTTAERDALQSQCNNQRQIIDDSLKPYATLTAERDAANKQTIITEAALENACRLISGGVLRAAGCEYSEGADVPQWFVDRAYLAMEEPK